eukprot:GHVQ01014879.1.p1 GENE.GHVQ01014879.1~~GHVQ01014879.1.p1  ORF type:complete len:1028 (+),score=142.62 GHVQ01014879.1:337-3420(+)
MGSSDKSLLPPECSSSANASVRCVGRLDPRNAAVKAESTDNETLEYERNVEQDPECSGRVCNNAVGDVKQRSSRASSSFVESCLPVGFSFFGFGSRSQKIEDPEPEQAAVGEHSPSLPVSCIQTLYSSRTSTKSLRSGCSSPTGGYGAAKSLSSVGAFTGPQLSDVAPLRYRSHGCSFSRAFSGAVKAGDPEASSNPLLTRLSSAVVQSSSPTESSPYNENWYASVLLELETNSRERSMSRRREKTETIRELSAQFETCGSVKATKGSGDGNVPQPGTVGRIAHLAQLGDSRALSELDKHTSRPVGVFAPQKSQASDVCYRWSGQINHKHAYVEKQRQDASNTEANRSILRLFSAEPVRPHEDNVVNVHLKQYHVCKKKEDPQECKFVSLPAYSPASSTRSTSMSTSSLTSTIHHLSKSVGKRIPPNTHPMDVVEYLYQWKQLKTYGESFSARGHQAVVSVTKSKVHCDLNRRTKAREREVKMSYMKEVSRRALRQQIRHHQQRQPQRLDSSSDGPEQCRTDYYENREGELQLTDVDMEGRVEEDEQGDSGTKEKRHEAKTSEAGPQTAHTEPRLDEPVLEYQVEDETATGSYVFAFGGFDGSACYNDLHCFDSFYQVWRRLSATATSRVPTWRSGACIFYDDCRLYVFGGVALRDSSTTLPFETLWKKNQTTLCDVFAYDLWSRRWEPHKPPAPPPGLMNDPSMVLNAPPLSPTQELKKLHELRTKQYELEEDRLLDEQLKRMESHTGAPLVVNEKQQFYPKTGKRKIWKGQLIEESPSPRRDMTVVMHNGVACFFGGTCDDNETPEFFDQVYLLNVQDSNTNDNSTSSPMSPTSPSSKSPPLPGWPYLAHMRWYRCCTVRSSPKVPLLFSRKHVQVAPRPRAFHSAVVAASAAPYLFYKPVPCSFSSSETENTTSEAHRSVDNEVRLSVPEPHGMTEEDGPRMLVFGGLTSEGRMLNDLFEYWLNLNVWTRGTVRSGTPPTPRYMHAAVVLEDSMFVFGGFSNPSTALNGNVWTIMSRSLRTKFV